jgi:hypothetical protein
MPASITGTLIAAVAPEPPAGPTATPTGGASGNQFAALLNTVLATDTTVTTGEIAPPTSELELPDQSDTDPTAALAAFAAGFLIPLPVNPEVVPTPPTGTGADTATPGRVGVATTPPLEFTPLVSVPLPVPTAEVQTPPTLLLPAAPGTPNLGAGVPRPTTSLVANTTDQPVPLPLTVPTNNPLPTTITPTVAERAEPLATAVAADPPPTRLSPATPDVAEPAAEPFATQPTIARSTVPVAVPQQQSPLQSRVLTTPPLVRIAEAPAAVEVSTEPQAPVRPTTATTSTVVPQTPVVADRGQLLPVAPTEVGFGAVRPPVTELTEIGGVAVAVQSGVRTGVGANLTPRPAVPTIEFTDRIGSTEPLAATFDEAVLRTQGEPAPTTVGPNIPQPTTTTTPTNQSAAVPTEARVQPGTPAFALEFVSQAHVTAHTDGRHEFRLRLDPPELGEVQVRLLTADGRLSAEVVVADDSVRRLIEGQLSDLRQRLEAAGTPVSKFDVTTQHGGESNRGRPEWDRTPWTPPTARTEAPAPPRHRPATVTGGLIDVTA